jgi:hypothetical protein
MTTSAIAQVSIYDGVTGILTLPAVKVGSAVFTNVTLLNVGNYTFALQGATEQVPPGAASVTYDGASGMVNIPAVKVGSTTYINVTLHNDGNFTFSLQSAAELPAATLSGVTAFLGAVDALWANAVPGSGALRYSLADSCLLDNGTTKSYLVSDWDANLQEQLARNAYQVGATRNNIQVLAVRDITNPDSSMREEVDVQFDVNYKDGSVLVGQVFTLISGSSAGSPGCANPQNSTDLRRYGNRQLIEASVRGRTRRDERYSITTGAPLATPVNYRRDVQFYITDPMGNATYVIVRGPGPTTMVNGVVTPFSLKLISPRLLRSAPELSGKNGNFLNLADDDAFGFCLISGNGVPVASIADCVGQGAGGNNWGLGTANPNATADTNFQNQGWLAGGNYTFAVYNDDGWKTVNGQAGKTPIATYSAVLEKLPYTFVEMAGSGVNADKFPRITFGGMTPAQVQANLISATPSPMNLAWTPLAALADGDKFRLFQGWQAFEGPQTGNATGVLYPGYALQLFNYPGSTATSLSGLQVAPKLAGMSSKTYEEFAVQYLDRNNTQIFSRVSFN